MNMTDTERFFADETELFRSPAEPEAEAVITFRFRAARGTGARIFLEGETVSAELCRTETDGAFDWFEAKLQIGREAFSYCFRVLSGEESLYLSRTGLTSGKPDRETMFQVIPGFRVPEWMKGAVIYQIFPDRFFDGDPSSDTLDREYFYLDRPVTHADWSSLPESPDVGRFYGGDLAGVLRKLDYLKYLGVEVLYLNPVFLSPSSHGYDTQSYDYVDPHLTGFVSDPAYGEEDLLPEGSSDNREAKRYLRRVLSPENLEGANRFFAHFISEVHARGMRVILDGVFNHCGSFHPFMDGEKIYFPQAVSSGTVGASVSEDSPYRSFFLFREGGSRPEEPDYEGWWGHKTLPKLHYEGSRELEQYILDTGRRWVSPPYSADGWRLDMAADLGQSAAYNHFFWKRFREEVKDANPGAVILAEHYGDPSPWLSGDQWDTVMNYDAFMDPVSLFLTGMEKHSDSRDPDYPGNAPRFLKDYTGASARLPGASLLSAMNQLSNHDHSRFLTRTNGRVGRLETEGAAAASEGISPEVFREGVVMLFTLPGAPAVYYGDEAGLTGWTDPDNRRPFPWGKEDFSLTVFHRDMIRIHRRYSCLRTGSFLPLRAERGFLAYGRFDRRSAVLVLINHSPAEREEELSVLSLGMPPEGETVRLMLTGGPLYNAGEKRCPIKNGRLKVSLPAFSASVYGMDL